MAPILGYTTAEASRMLRLEPARIRSFVRSGFLEPERGPRREYRFRFQDLVVLRAARDLAAQKIPPRRLRRVLRDLRAQLPRGRSLAELRISFEAGNIVVRSGGEAWEPESGQRLLDFEVAELAAKAAPLAPVLIQRAGDPSVLTAEDWYELGFELEASSIDQARAAYERALDSDEGHADAHLNLGRLVHEEGHPESAFGHYQAALTLRPDDATAAFNLGVAHQDLGKIEEALACYRASLEADPSLADAHFNLAVLLEQAGDSAGTIRHLKAYMRMKGLRVGLGAR
ncbi:MAG: tetratricopeptide repeat protein [bacterium]|nr:tetratricopeptide repeat protein [bacterium]